MAFDRNWPAILEDLESSGLSITAYSRKAGIPYSTIMAHRHNARKSAPALSPEAVGFVSIDARPISEAASSGIRILVDDNVVEVDSNFNRKTLAAVLEVLHAGA